MSNPQANTKEQIQEQLDKKKKKSNGSSSKELAMVQKIQPYIEDALPESFGSKERFLNVCLTTLRQNPDLMKCDRASLYGALLSSAQLGLTPNTLGQSYIVPFRDKNKRKKQAQLIIGYRGMIDLARRSGDLQSCTARIVHENDRFEVNYASSNPIEVHEPWWMTDAESPGDVFAAYFIADMGASKHVEIMHISELESHRKQYVQGSTQMSDEDWYKKTVTRRAFKWLPVSTEAARAEEMDQSVSRFDTEDEELEVIPENVQETDDEEWSTETDQNYEVKTDEEKESDPESEEDSDKEQLEESWVDSKEAAKQFVENKGWEDDFDFRQSHDKIKDQIRDKLNNTVNQVGESENDEPENPFDPDA